MAVQKVLSIQVPAPCPLACSFCRTPDHNQGDAQKVLQIVAERIGEYEEVYITSNGETGLSPIFSALVDLATRKGLRVAVLCATEYSVVSGLARVEISLNKYTEALAIRAIQKAREMGIPTVASMVDDGPPIDLEAIANKYRVDGVLVRALQAEGRSELSRGVTRFFSRVGAKLGHFPVAAYRELVGIGTESACINHCGDFVPLLGGA